jgi:S1-C subfamily serine protease
LGVGVAEIDSERAKALKLNEERGVEVKKVKTGSAAEKAGLQQGDVVLEYNGQRVEGVEQFQRYVRETPPGREVRLVISRGGSTRTVTAKLGTRRGVIARWDGSGLNIPIPPVPPVPPIHVEIPDAPRGALSWRNSTLGVETESLGPQLAAFFGVKDGLLVRSVSEGSAAEKAGIKAGDVIVKVNNVDVSTPRQISSALRSAQSKKTVPVVLVRSQKELTVTVDIAASGPDRQIELGEPTDVLTRTRA